MCISPILKFSLWSSVWLYLKNISCGVAGWLAESVEHAAFALRIVSSNPTLDIELLRKKI